MTRVIAATVLAALVCAGCRVDRARYTFIPITGGVVTTQGVTITAEDNSFTLVAGQRFSSPFQQGDQCLLNPTAENYAQGIATGARPVVIDFASGKRLYGLLSLCGAPPSSSGAAAARQYQIEVPDSYIAETAGGRVSVVFEWFTSGTLQAKSWILWLSETSFAQQPAAGGGETSSARIDKDLNAATGSMKVAMWSGIIGGVFGLIALGVLTNDPEGGEIAVGAVSALLGFTALVMWPIFFGAAKGAERKVQTQLGSVEANRPVDLIGRGAPARPTLGWSWSF